ncbi:capsular exopolysaccharide family [Bryocella elongata]|uniref:Capsular exopolysaccharide family n=1 Tax=Bryocella elongata TaxID=863522 RepID=A0A1H5XRH7_9BACT|nr:CpsD/CapB family tyrosine-protein kinase [Bryocella elongata]SEG14037.1 capsular exopolysaccharide family [Bryocella elongata]
MSKIYEALIRAEQERAEIEKSRSERLVSAVDAEPVAVANPIPLAQPAPFAEQPVFAAPRQVYAEPVPAVPAQVLTADSTNQAEGPVFAPDAILPTVWQPQWSHLPSLQERGRGLEQFRTLRSHMLEFRDADALKTILVSSGLPQEGKSFVAANLALSFARHKSARVLLIDGDMRRSSLHILLGCSNQVGLTTYLSGHASLEQVMQRALVDESDRKLQGLSSLTFIAGGAEGENAADLSSNKRFDEMIHRVSPYFDWIVVDTSPVNLVADGVNLSRACDAVLLVVRGGVTKLETAQRALNELKASKVLGVVLNAVEDLPAATGYYGYATYDNYDTIKE